MIIKINLINWIWNIVTTLWSVKMPACEIFLKIHEMMIYCHFLRPVCWWMSPRKTAFFCCPSFSPLSIGRPTTPRNLWYFCIMEPARMKNGCSRFRSPTGSMIAAEGYFIQYKMDCNLKKITWDVYELIEFFKTTTN